MLAAPKPSQPAPASGIFFRSDGTIGLARVLDAQMGTFEPRRHFACWEPKGGDITGACCAFECELSARLPRETLHHRQPWHGPLAGWLRSRHARPRVRHGETDIGARRKTAAAARTYGDGLG